MRMILDDRVIDAIVTMIMELQDQENTAIPLLEKQLRSVNTSIDNLLNAIQQGILTPSTKQRLEELEASKEEIEIKLANEQLMKLRVPESYVRNWLLQFRSLDITAQAGRKMLIDIFVNRIYLYDDKLVITFNYKDNQKTVSFADAQESLKKVETGSDLDCPGAPKARSREGLGLFLFFTGS